MTWPLTVEAGTAVQDLGDPVFEIWVMRAVQHQLATDPLHLYDGNAFFPFEQSLAYSEEAISTALLAWPVYLVSGNDVLAYNVIFLTSWWLVAIGVYLLVKELGASPGAAFIAGLIAAFAPARYGHLSHLHLLVFGWLPLALWAMIRFHRTGRARYALLTGLFLTIQLLGSLHLAVFGTIALALFVPLLLLFDRQRSVSRADSGLLAASIIIPYLIFIPTLIPHFQVGELYGFERRREEIESLAATIKSYRSVFVTNTFLNRWLPGIPEPFFPGIVALVGLAALAFIRRWQWPITFAALVTASAVLLSFGFAVEVAGFRVPMPYATVYDLLPPVRNIRGIGRIGLLTAISIPILAGLGFTAAWSRIGERFGSYRLLAGVGLTLLLSLVVLVELRSSVNTEPVPNEASSMAVYEWLADQPEGPVAEFPSAGLIHGNFEPISYMYGSTRHWNPILAGYSGYIPQAHYDIQYFLDHQEEQQSYLTAENTGVLQDLGVRWVIFHQLPGYDWEFATEQAALVDDLTFVTEINGSRVYELAPGERGAPYLAIEETTRQSSASGPVTLPLHIVNPNGSPAISRLNAGDTVELIWEDESGATVKRETLPINIPTILPAGDNEVQIHAIAPEVPGNYTMRIVPATQKMDEAALQFTVHPRPDWLEPPVAIESVIWNEDSARPGSTVTIEVTWLIREPLFADYSATAQLYDDSGNRVSQLDLEPYGGMPPSSSWQAGDTVTTTFEMPIPGETAPGNNYRLMIALYARTPDFPRVPIQQAEGTSATEFWVERFEINP